MKQITTIVLLAFLMFSAHLLAGGSSDFVSPPPGMPGCAVNPEPGQTVCTATPICNVHGFCGTTSGSYTADYWSNLNTAFCGSIENNAFLTFTAQSANITFDCYVYNCYGDEGIQVFIFKADNCTGGPVQSFVCVNEMYAQNTPYNVSASGLIPGEQYYIMIDGFAGDICDYTFVATSGVAMPLSLTSGPEVTVCRGESFTTTPIGGSGNYYWDPSPDLTATGNPNEMKVTPPTTVGTYTYVVHSTGDVVPGCPETNDYVLTVNVINCCYIENNIDNTICDVDNNQYGVGGVITVYDGPATGDLVIEDCNGTTHVVASAPFTSEQFTYNISNLSLSTPNCNFETYFTNLPSCSHVLTHQAPPTTIPTHSPMSVCQDDITQALPSTSTNGIPGTWTPAIINTAIPGTQTFTFTAANGYCSPTSTMQVTVNPKPVVDIIVNPITYHCSIETEVTVQATSDTPGATYSWTDSLGGQFGLVSGSNTLTPTINLMGQYELIAINPTTGCRDTFHLDVIGDGMQPEVEITEPLIINCLTSEITLNASITSDASPNGPFTYEWNTTTGNFLTGTTGTTTNNNTSVTVNGGGIYTLLVTDPSSDCQNGAMVNVIVDTVKPYIAPIEVNNITCLHIYDTLSGNFDIANPSYEWTTTNGNILGGLDQHIVADLAGEYTFTLTNLDNGCVNSQTVTLSGDTIHPNITAGPDLKICPEGTVMLEGTSTTTNVSYSWTATDGNVTLTDFSNIPNPTVPSPGIFILTVTDNINLCTSVDTAIVTPYNPITIFADTTVCAPTFTVPQGSVTTNLTGTWTSTPTASFSDNSSLTPTFTPTEGTTTYILTYEDVCETVSATVIFPPAPVVQTPPAFTCNHMLEHLVVTSYGGGYWAVVENPSTPFIEDTAVTFLPSPNIPAGVVNYSIDVSSHPTAGTYTFIYTDTTCNYSKTVTITFIDYPWTEIKDTAVCIGTPINMTAANYPSTTSYTWSTGETTQTINITTPGVYYVEASNQCYTYEDSATVLHKLCDVFPPNIISLSSQVGNNQWFVLHDGVTNFECLILNRWGNLIYEFNDPNHTWLGTDKNGNKVTEGTYFYKLRATLDNGEILEKHGFIQVVH